MYDYKIFLREASQKVLEAKGYEIIFLKGARGARLKLRKHERELIALVRTSADGWIGWMRAEADAWRGLEKADLVITSSLEGTSDAPIAVVRAFRPQVVQKALDDNLAAWRRIRTPAQNAPIFVSLAHLDAERGAAAAGSNLKAKALWEEQVPLRLEEAQVPRDAAQEAPAGAEDPAAGMQEGILAKLRQGFAELAGSMGVPLAKVTIEIEVRVSL